VADRPEVSVLLPAFDAEATLAGALESVRRQTLARFECVVVDDGSRDGTADLARRVAARDARFRVLARPHGGIVAALTAGLEACRAPYVARMDADDLMRANRLEVQVAQLREDRSIDAVGGHVRLFPRAILGRGWRSYETWLEGVATPEDIAREAFVECPIAHPTLVARTDVLRSHGWRDRPWPEDYDLVLRLLARGRRLAVVRRRVLSWRRGPGRLSDRDPRYSDDAFARCKAHFLARGFLAGSDRFRLLGYGHTGRALTRALADEGLRPERIVDLHPARLGQMIAGAEVVPPERIGTPSEGPPVLASIARAGPRAEIRGFLERRGFVEGKHFVCVA
jgi:cellulose synthase/poly-beta-1,6-N-acetylglucosamine synthase-like glycosyltransferase